MHCGLLGKKLGHSYSPQIHSLLGNYSYGLFEKTPEELPEFLQSGSFSGLNVTIPYKKEVIPYLSELSPVARKLGAVNTVVRKEDGRLIGHNTDYFGFETMLSDARLSVSGKKVLVLGSGGASNTAVSVLQAKGAQVVVISRNGKNNYGNLHHHADAAVLVNTTPVGMYPDVGVSPVDLDAFPQLEGVLDVVYNPARTRLLMDAEARGLITANGLKMLVGQAAESSQWFAGLHIPAERIDAVYRKIRNSMENIILIGMPGSGKTSVGKLLAELTGKTFVDTDAEITKKAGKSIPEIFAEVGESGFRVLETEVLGEVGCRSGLVIATGGGCVTRVENYPLLHQNGSIFCLDRALDTLPVDGRPLSQTTDLSQMYQSRKPLYHRFADHCIDNSGRIDQAAQHILQLWEEEI